jgi:hypothetical protein
LKKIDNAFALKRMIAQGYNISPCTLNFECGSGIYPRATSCVLSVNNGKIDSGVLLERTQQARHRLAARSSNDITEDYHAKMFATF